MPFGDNASRFGKDRCEAKKAPDDAVCVTCFRRSKPCVSQEVFEESEVAEGNLGRTQRQDGLYYRPVENDVYSVQPGQRVEVDACDSSTCKSKLPPSATPVHHSPLDYATNQDYATNHENREQTEQLVNPFMTTGSSPWLAPVHVPIPVLDKRRKITQALLSVLPAQKDIEILQERVARVSLLCYQSNYKSKGLLQKELPEEQIPLRSLLHPESHPVLLARQMLSFAAGLQHISPKEGIPNLTEHHYAIMERLAESSIQLVTANDALVGTLEGLENIILEAFYHIDGGNIRRAWLAIRRAVMAAQLLGLQRPGQYRYKVINDQNKLDPEAMWGCVTSMETVLSLLLGLPASTVTTRRPAKDATETSKQNSNLPALVQDVAARILERNEIHTPELALDLTREIDREFIVMTDQMPSTFWRPSTFVGLELDSESAFWEIRRTWDLMCYYTLVNQLHLPYMLRSTHTPQGTYSRLACVNASREILAREIALRTFNSITACCRMSDFMALIAGMTLMLAHIVSHCQKETDNLLIHQRPGDRAIVTKALECMKSMSELREDVLSAKCAALLHQLLEVEADAAQGQSYSAQKLAWTNESCDHDQNALIIKVPYVGVFRIAPDSIKPMAPLKMGQERGIHEEVTIGGMGSLHVNMSRLPEQNKGEDPSITAAPQAAITQLVDATSSHEFATHIPQTTSEHVSVQPDPMFPDAAASMNDWVFQGFDTAFFDVLMRSASDPFLDSANADGWDFQTFD